MTDLTLADWTERARRVKTVWPGFIGSRAGDSIFGERLADGIPDPAAMMKHLARPPSHPSRAAAGEGSLPPLPLAGEGRGGGLSGRTRW